MIAAIVPSLNRPALLRETLTSLVEQTLQPSEILVVDDGSNPPVDSRALCAEFGGRVRVLRNHRSMGLAYARNRGVEEASAKYVVHVDDDDLLAPTTLEDAVRVLQTDSSVEVVFLGIQGFGIHSEYFNRIQAAAVAKAVSRAEGKRVQPAQVHFDSRLMNAMLEAVPSAFQHVVVPRRIWEKVSLLRWRAYQLSSSDADIEAIKTAITGQLRDSEWALYAAAICRHTVLLDAPYYLARCEGQGTSSRPENRERHLYQSILIKTQLVDATRLPELSAWAQQARKSLANTHADAAYHFLKQSNRHASREHAVKAARLSPTLRHMKALIRTLLPYGRPE